MRIRPLLVTVPGIVLPHPYGGQDMQVMVNLDQQKLLARHLTPTDIHDVLMKQYLVLPAGDIKIKSTDWIVLTNASPLKIEHFDDIPIKREGNAFIYLRDVATVQLMGRVQQNAVLVKGKQTVIIVAMKSTEASTLDVVDGIKKMIPRAEQISPEGVQIRLLDDASTFVKDSISDVVHEMAARRRAGRPHRAVAARLLAGHGHRLDLDPALHSDRDHRPALARTRRSTS